MRLTLRILAALLLLLPIAARAQTQAQMAEAVLLSKGEERILNFVSAVTVEKNGDLDVTETIRLVSLNNEIRRGIQRDFPTSYSTGFGQRTRVGFSVVSVQRDGKDEPWERMSLENGVRMRIGSADVMLPIGVHEYKIRYKTTRQIRYFEGYDEIYWNVTGNGWTFPIDSAEARITLPTDGKFGDRAVYTGYQGATDKDAQVIEERPGFIAFRTTKGLEREQGLTVAAAFPKGVLDAPGDSQRMGWWLEDWGVVCAAGLSLIGLIFFYLRSWIKVGRGPRAGTVVPTFSPPDGLSPAACRYISRMKFDNEAFSAAIVDLGVHGQLHIHQEEGGWLSRGKTTLSRTDIGKTGHPHDVGKPESAMRTRLFSGRDSIKLEQGNHKTLQAARAALEAGLKRDYGTTMFVDNKRWSIAGIVAIPIAVITLAMIAMMFDPTSGPMTQLIIPLSSIGLFALAWYLVRIAKSGGKSWHYFFAWLGVFLIGGLAVMLAFATVIAALTAGAFVIFAPLLLLPVAILAFRWMYAPTVEGRAVMDRIAGFRQYLGITEEDRLEALHPPEKTPELFERYLPYAIALDVENRWADKFAAVLATAAAAGAATQTMGWYSGDSNMWRDPGGFANTVGSSLASTVSSAATSPSSSSGGSSGGGSSGGGGGGGGGSGW